MEKDTVKPTWKHWIKNSYYNFKSFRVYWAYREYEANSVKTTTWIDEAIEKGFTPASPTDGNWFGVSKSHPDNVYTRGDKKIFLSLQGLSMPVKFNEHGEVCEKFMQACYTISCKYIAFQQSGDIIYEDWFGNLPDNNFIQKFIAL